MLMVPREAPIPVQTVDRDDAIIAVATEILRARMLRLGTLSDPTAATNFLRMRLGGIDHEVFYVMYLDGRHSIIAAEVAFSGTIDGAEVHPRVIVKQALRHNAAAIICAHNHPSNNAEPSAADRALTARLKQALALVDVRLLDHFVVTASDCTSLAARGWV
jgi:DNA repair protein RadC